MTAPKQRLADRVRAAAAEAPYRKRAWLRAQLGDEAADLDALLADPSVPPMHIWRELKERGFKIGKATIYVWAEGDRG